MMEAIIKPATNPRTQPQPLLNDWKKLIMTEKQPQYESA